MNNYGTDNIIIIYYANRLNYSDGVYSDAQGVNVTAGPFGSVYSLLNFSEFFPPPSNPDFVEYFVHRGYVADVNIRAAPYDWRLGAGKYVNWLCSSL